MKSLLQCQYIRLCLFSIICAFSVPFAWSDTVYQWTNLAGQPGGPGSNDGLGTSASFYGPSGIAVDMAGNKYVADRYNHTIRKITPSGVVTTLAGASGAFGSVDGKGGMARFSNPRKVAVDGSGNLYVADLGNHTIRKITASGVVTTLAGSAGLAGIADGSSGAARFNQPSGLALDASGNLFVADSLNHTIRKVTPAGVVTTFAGQAGASGSTDGTGGNARFNYPGGVSVDSNNELYVADGNNQTIRKITAAGVVTTIAGSPGLSGSADGTGSTARFYKPTDVAIDTGGNVYVADENNYTIRKVSPGGVVTTLAGSPGIIGNIDGTGAASRFQFVSGLAVDLSGNVYVADNGNTIRMVTPAGVVTTIAGSAGGRGSADGTGSMAQFYDPSGVAVDGAGITYVADRANSVIRKVTPAGVVTTLAGSAGVTGSLDGTGNAARFKYPQGIAVDSSENVYVADTGNFTIRKITSAGVVTTLAGSAGVSGTLDGMGGAARFSFLGGVTVDGAGNLYVADTSNNTIRKVTPAGLVTTLAGSAGAFGSTDGTGNAARFGSPQSVAVDGDGNVFVAEISNHTIRKVTSSGVVTTLAGSAGLSGSVDGVGNAARFKSPYGVTVDASGNIFVSDKDNHTIRKVNPGGAVTTIGGIPSRSGYADGLGQSALFAYPRSVAIGSDGKLVVADGNNRISVGTLAGSKPIVRLTPVSPLSGTTATLNGKINPNGLATTAFFEYGDSPLYGQTATVILLPDNDAVDHDVSATLTGLTLNATYYYRLTATNADGTASTIGGIFTTMVPPTFTCPLATSANRGYGFSFTLIADQAPTTYGATGLPGGLSLDSSTGIISGTPTTLGTTSVTVTASNAAGTATATLELTVLAGLSRDLLVSQPSTSSILRFDGATGAAKGAFIAAGAGGLSSPRQMTIGPDGNLYVADGTGNNVKRYSILDGSFIDNFTAAGSVTDPIALRFGPNGELYVLCGGTNRKIHKFNGTTGAYEALVVNAPSTRMSSQSDFLLMPNTGDFLVVNPGSLNRVSRFSSSSGVFTSYYINSTGSTSTLNSPTSIIIGPDGNYWVTSSGGTNKITRFNIGNGAKIDDAFFGLSINNGHQEQQYRDGYLFVANGSGNNIIAYDCSTYLESPSGFQISQSGRAAVGDGFEFVLQGSQGLTNPKNILFVDINVPPVANAGADLSVGIGQQFSLNGSTSSDPEGDALTYAWTQLSGPPVLPGPSVVSGSATSATLDILAPPDAPVPLAFQLTVSDGVRTATDTVTVQVTAPPPETWRYQYFTSIHNSGSAADNADPDNDGLINLLERAFNLNPNQAAHPILTAGTGTTGLPLIRRTGHPPMFSIQYLRRKGSVNSGLTYTPQFSSGLAEPWTDATGIETVESINSEWERVTIVDPAPVSNRRFGRLKVTGQ